MGILAFIVYCAAIFGVAAISSRFTRRDAAGRAKFNWAALVIVGIILLTMGPAKTKIAEWGFPGNYAGVNIALTVVLLVPAVVIIGAALVRSQRS